MENENKDTFNGDEIPKNEFEQEDIPLWLQGIEEADEERLVPEEKLADVSGDWIKEIPEEIKEDPPEFDNSEDLLQDGEKLPEWIEEEPVKSSEASFDPGLENAPEDEMHDPDIEQEEFPPIRWDSPEHDIHEEITSSDQLNKVPEQSEIKANEEEFLEISDADIQDDQPTKDIPESDNQELPSWLQEMISEPQENETIEPKLESEENNAIHKEKPESEGNSDEGFEEDFPQEFMAELTEAQIEEAVSPSPHDSDLIAEENTKPVFIKSDEKAPPEIPEIEEGSDQKHSDELPKDLLQARMLLEDGDYTGALEAMSACQEKSEYHDEIRSWFLSAAEADKSKAGEAWEAIGDLELGENNHAAALDAYAKAIRSLLHNRKALDEVD